MKTWNKRGAKKKQSSRRCAAAVEGGAVGWKHFWHHLEGKTEMTVQTKAPESQFAYVVLAARRARQIMAGAPPMLDNPRTLKPTRVACEEVNSGLIEYEFSPGKSVDEDKDGVKRRK